MKLNASDLRLPSRAWKVKLVGEGADDAGGVFDDTITEMCQVGVPAAQPLRPRPGSSAARLSVCAGVGDGRGRPAHPLPQRHGGGGLQPRQVSAGRRAELVRPRAAVLTPPVLVMLPGSS